MNILYCGDENIEKRISNINIVAIKKRKRKATNICINNGFRR